MDFAPTGHARPHGECENYPPGAAANYGADALTKSADGGIGHSQMDGILARLAKLEAESESRQELASGSKLVALEAHQRDTDESIASIRGVVCLCFILCPLVLCDLTVYDAAGHPRGGDQRAPAQLRAH